MFSENVQQTCRRTPLPKCGFNKVASQLHTGKVGLRPQGGTQDLEPWGGTMGWDPKVGPWGGTLGLVLGVGPQVGTLGQNPGVKHIIYPRVIRYQCTHKIYTLDNLFHIAIFGNRVSPSPYNEKFMLSTRSHICVTILLKCPI